MHQVRKIIPLFAISGILIIPLIYSCVSCNAQSLPSKTLLALSKHDHTLAIVDASTFKVLGKVPVGIDPHEVIASTDGKTAYVSIYGGGSLHTINVIDLVTRKRLDDIDTRPLFGPHGLMFADNKLWFAAEGSKAVGCYNPSTRQLEWAMGTGQDKTHMIYVSNNAKKIYTTNMASGTVSILQDKTTTPSAPQQGKTQSPAMQPAGKWEQTLINVSKGSEGIDVTPDQSELWTASAQDGKIYIINLSTQQLEETIDGKVNGANRLKFTPDGKLIFISSLASGNLTVYDVKTRRQLKQINIGRGAAGITMQPDGSRAYVACTPDNYVAVIELSTLTVTNKIDVGGEPDGLAWREE